MSYTPAVRETRSEHQRFVPRLRGRSASERARLQMGHTAYLAGEREKDTELTMSQSELRHDHAHLYDPHWKRCVLSSG
ncbi:hypothetical protein PHMEG_00020839 [Phytophthora megakarya]|uniref:Uncharacterized protein n=1 Tax=Phytophthora megakarya TaxID=4795 RepID=A0A225VNE1_9STRA|nr:hypothetical protein PHMEG_00020839 [Phytophthora megakarya]